MADLIIAAIAGLIAFGVTRRFYKRIRSESTLALLRRHAAVVGVIAVMLLVGGLTDSDRGFSPGLALLMALDLGGGALVGLLVAASLPHGHRASQRLLQSAHAGYAQRAIDSLARGASFKDVDENGWTAIDYAVAGGHPYTLQRLLDAGAQPTKTAVAEAMRLGRTEFLRILLDRAPSLATGELLTEAHASGNETATDLLLKRGLGSRGLATAIEKEQDATIAYLFNCGVAPSAPALTAAAGKERWDLVDELLRRGAPATGDAILPAIHSERTEVVLRLLDAGVSPNAPNALAAAVTGGNEAIVELLLSRGADPNTRFVLGWPVLWLAASHGQTAIVKQLIEHGAEVDATDDSGHTVLTDPILADALSPSIRDMLKVSRPG